MAESTEKSVASTEQKTAAADLVDDVRESAKAGQDAAGEALRKFVRTIDEFECR